MPAALLERLRVTLKAAGLRVAAVDVEVMTLYPAALARGVLPAQAPVALVEAGHSRMRAAIFNGGWPALVRSLDVLPLIPGEAEPNPGARHQTPEDFATEVRRTTEILMSQSHTESLAGMLLAARWPAAEIAPLVAGEIVQAGRTPEGFQVTMTGESVPPGFTVAYGLALTLAAEPRSLHLLPRVPLDVQRQRVNQAIAEHNAYLARQAEVAATEARRRALDPLIQTTRSRLPWTVLYPHLRSLLPPGVRVQSIAVQGDSLSLTGQAESLEAMAEFGQRLQDSPWIKLPSCTATRPPVARSASPAS